MLPSLEYQNILSFKRHAINDDWILKLRKPGHKMNFEAHDFSCLDNAKILEQSWTHLKIKLSCPHSYKDLNIFVHL